MKDRVLGLTAALIMVVGGSLLAGCGGGASDTASKSGSATGDHGSADATEAPANGDHAMGSADANSSAPPAHVIPAGTEVTLTGTVGCGHCTYQIGNSCSTAMRTSDGIVWILDGIGAGNELFENRFDAGEITMAGTVSYVDGVAHLTPAPQPDAGSQM